ncbi:MAG: DUF1080 domain-containing protein [Methylovulum sp.]|nr:DUF1080 domain-containing protein [Methylovulum sp.]
MNRQIALTATLMSVLAWSQASVADVYEEDFEDGQAQLWAPQKPGQWQVAGKPEINQYYQAKAGTSFNGGMVSTLGGTDYRNVDYRVSVKHDNDGILATYILFRATPNFQGCFSLCSTSKGTGYAFGIVAGEFCFYKINHGVTTTIQSWTRSSYLKPIKQWNKLRVIAKGSSFKFYINDALVYRYTDTDQPIRSGQMGLLGYSGTSYPTTHGYDNISATPLPAALNTTAETEETLSPEQEQANAFPLVGFGPDGLPAQ